MALFAYLIAPEKVVLSGSMINDMTDNTRKKLKEIIDSYDLSIDFDFKRTDDEFGPGQGLLL